MAVAAAVAAAAMAAVAVTAGVGVAVMGGVGVVATAASVPSAAAVAEERRPLQAPPGQVGWPRCLARLWARKY